MDMDRIGDELQRAVGETPNLDFDPQTAALRTLAERQLCKRHLLPFIMKSNPSYQPGWVHRLICQKLEKFSADIVAKKSPRLMLFMPPRHGKQVADSTPVLTYNRGWIKHGELTTNDYVFSPEGRPIKVLAVSEKTASDWEVEFTNGTTIRCHGNHEWTVYDRAARKSRTVETKWFRRKTKFGKTAQVQSGGRAIYQLPCVAPLHGESKALLMPPYVLGAWLGDGTKGKGAITHALSDAGVIKRVESYGYEITVQHTHKDTGVITTCFSGPRPGVAGRMLQELKQLGIVRNKHIPQEYLKASQAQRLELLAGLIDTDGSTDGASRMRFTTADKQLAEDVKDLCLTLGFRPYVRTEQPKLSSSGIQGRKEYYVVGFQPTLPIPCALARKLPKRFAKQRAIGIADVRRNPNGEKGHCIQVDAKDGLYLVGESLLPTHNSEIASRTFPTWHLGRNPKHEVIACSYASNLALKFSRKARGLARDPLFRNVFGVELDPDQQSAENWLTLEGGGYMPAGVQGPITGNGAHLGIIDDPVKNRDEAESSTVRESIKDWYTSTFYTRLAPGGGVLIILTRWHDDDLAGWQLQQMFDGFGDEWEVVKFPAIATEDELYRKKGEALHPDRYPVEALNRIKRVVGVRDWNSLYQQNPVADEGEYFNKDMIKYYRTVDLPKRDELTFYTAWDFAIGKKESNDWTVGITVAFDQQDRVFIVDLVRGRWDAYEIVEQMLDSFATWRPMQVGLEKGQISMALGPHLERRIAERQLWDFPYSEESLLKTGKADKQVRARSIQGRMRQGKVFFPEDASWLQELVNELLRFPSGVHDDQVDALAWVGIMMTKFAHTSTQPEDTTPKWLQRYLTESASSGHVSAMSA